MKLEEQIKQYNPIHTYRQGNITYAIGLTKFLVVDWDMHSLKTYDYKSLLITAGTDAAFTDFSSDQEISFLKIYCNLNEYHLIADHLNELEAFHLNMIKRMSEF